MTKEVVGIQYNYFFEGSKPRTLLTFLVSMTLSTLMNQDLALKLNISMTSLGLSFTSVECKRFDVQLIRTTSGNSYGYEPKNETTEVGSDLFFR